MLKIILTVCANIALALVGAGAGYVTHLFALNADTTALACAMTASAMCCFGTFFFAPLSMERSMVVATGIGIPLSFAAIIAEWLGNNAASTSVTSLLSELVALLGDLASMLIYGVAGVAGIVCMMLFSFFVGFAFTGEESVHCSH